MWTERNHCWTVPWSTCPHLHLPSTSISLCFPSTRTATTTPPTRLLFGRYAEQSPLTRHMWPKTWSTHPRPSGSSWTTFHGHSVAGLLWDRHFEEVLLWLGCEKKYGTGNVNLFIENKDSSHEATWMTSKNGWKKAEYGSHVEENWSSLWIFENQHPFSTT